MFLFACSSKDLLMRVVAQNLSPELTLVEKVNTFQAFSSVAIGHLKFLVFDHFKRIDFLNGSLIPILISFHH